MHQPLSFLFFYSACPTRLGQPTPINPKPTNLITQATFVRDEGKFRGIKDKLIKRARVSQVDWTHGEVHPWPNTNGKAEEN